MSLGTHVIEGGSFRPCAHTRKCVPMALTAQLLNSSNYSQERNILSERRQSCLPIGSRATSRHLGLERDEFGKP